MLSEQYLNEVRSASKDRLEALGRELSVAKDILKSDGTVFATGSYGRLEASPNSDLDVFIVSLEKSPPSGKPLFDIIRQIKLKAELINAAEKVGMAEFDGGGKFLETHLSSDLINEVGSPSDDFKNTFTGRMLLILESRPILGYDVYEKIKISAIDCYFRDYPGIENKFVPYFLVNDILRMWRTFCVNYEHFRGSSDTRVKNLKLKYMRMLTCYSAIIYILAAFRMQGAVSPKDIFDLSSLTPTERLLEFGASGRFSELGAERDILSTCREAVAEYGEFLEFVQEKQAAIKALKQDEERWRDRSYLFGGKIVSLIHKLAGDEYLANPLYRSILV